MRECFLLSLALVLEICVAYGMLLAFESARPEELAENAEHMQQNPVEEIPVVSLSIPDILPPPKSPIVVHNLDPEVIKAVYLTSWSGGSSRMIDYVVQLANTTELNAVVIDIKDFSGEVAYKTNVPEVAQYGAERIKIRNIEALIKKLHEQGIYVIARITVFQDPVLTRARPDLAVQSIAEQGVWTDYKGLGWVDPASLEVWNYTVALARDAASRGFDEINFDYARFPSDGNLKDMKFPVWDGQTSKQQILRNFFAYLRANLVDVTISADFFGLATSSRDDLGIGQIIEDAYEYFDYVYPMVYPSHYANGYRGYQEPAEYPYEVVHFSLVAAQARLKALKLANPEKQFATLRPWLQDFDLGATYSPIMVQAQVQAAQDALGPEFRGFLLWSPTNYYTVQALSPFIFDRPAYNVRPRTLFEQTP